MIRGHALHDVIDHIRAHGPTRVIVSAEGEAVSPRRARLMGASPEEAYTPDVIFVRNDGWSLGAPKRWEKVAETTWPDSWVAVIRGKVVETYERNVS